MLAAAALAVALQAAPAGAVDPASPEGAAVMAPVNAVFAALAARDGEAILEHVERDGRVTVVVQRFDGQIRVSSPTWTDFAAGLKPGPERFEEVMPDSTVAIDDNIAVVWGRYAFRIDGQISHCGVNHFDLIRRNDEWAIVNLTWSQRAMPCEGF